MKRLRVEVLFIMGALVAMGVIGFALGVDEGRSQMRASLDACIHGDVEKVMREVARE